jgi:glycosyltransferase involved in cell wall biosynthesis
MPDQFEEQKETGPAPPPQETPQPSQPQQPQNQPESRGHRPQGGRPREQRPRRDPRPQQQQQRRPEGGDQRDEGTKVSVVIPLYNEEQSLRELFDGLRNVLGRLGKYEVIFVDDGSTDGSSRVLQELRQRDRRVKIIRFRRNYGKSAALSVGFHHARGEFVITMDADLQDDAQEIPGIINELKKGYDLISGWKKKRFDPISKTIPSRFFNFVTSVLTGIKLHDFNCGLKGYRREVVKEVKLHGELHRYIPVLARWLGFKVGETVVKHHPRKYGKTKFGMGRFWKGFLDLLTVLFTTRYMQRPLHLFGFWGMISFLAGFLIDGYLVTLKFTEGLALSNRPLFLGGILLIIVGVQLISLGLLGEIVIKSSQKTDEYSIREVWK